MRSGYCSLSQLTEIHESMHLGVIVLDDRHRVVAISPLARTLLTSKGLAPDGSLHRDLLQDVLRRSRAKTPIRSAMHMMVRRPGQVGALFVYVLRVTISASEQGLPVEHYLLLLRDPMMMLTDEAKVLGEVFGLTQRESELACYLALGAGLSRFARDKFVSLYTAKSHLKQIFRKVGVHKQTELVVNVLAVVL